mgnify:CR=1 FL=1
MTEMIEHNRRLTIESMASRERSAGFVAYTSELVGRKAVCGVRVISQSILKEKLSIFDEKWDVDDQIDYRDLSKMKDFGFSK